MKNSRGAFNHWDDLGVMNHQKLSFYIFYFLIKLPVFINFKTDEFVHCHSGRSRSISIRKSPKVIFLLIQNTGMNEIYSVI